MFQLTHLSGFGGRLLLENKFLASYGINVNQSVFTFSGCDFGTPDITRIIIAGVCGSGGSTANISSVSIGGVSATQIIRLSAPSVQAQPAVGIYAAVVPTDASGDIVVTFGGAKNRCAVFTDVIYKDSITAANTSSQSATTTTCTIPAVSMAANSYAVAVSEADVTSDFTWSSITKRAEQDLSDSASSASDFYTSADASFSPASISSATPAYHRAALAIWSF